MLKTKNDRRIVFVNEILKKRLKGSIINEMKEEMVIRFKEDPKKDIFEIIHDNIM